MGSVQTAIQLQDNFTNVILGIINSVNLAVSAMDDMSSAMSGDIDTTAIQAARNQINQANAAANQLNATLDSMAQQPVVNNNGNTVPLPTGSQGTGAPVNVPPIIHPDPVTVPVVWETSNLDVFTNTGIDRFEQEAQSANAMLERLGSVQDNITRQAFRTSILPPQAFQDLSSMAQRIDNVRERIQQIEDNPLNVGADTANAELEHLRGYLSQALDAQESLNRAMQDMDVSAANDSYLRLSQTVGNTERYLRDNVDEQGRFNQEIQEGTNHADTLMRTIMGAVSAYVGIQSVKNALSASDELTLTTSRLDMMNDGVQTTRDLVNMVYVAAQDARGSFSDMADVVARFGNNAKDAFSSSAEVIQFAGLIQKQMAIAGASTDEAANAQLQLSQALGSGVLRGDELNSIFEQAPNLIQNIADYLEVPIGKIREMAADGELSADIVKQAIFAATDKINENFNKMPMTWGQIWQSMQNTALIAFQPVLEQLNEIANSEGFQSFINMAIEGMATLASVTLDVFSLVGNTGSFIAENWSIISPFVYGAAAALAVYYGWQFAVNALNMISNGIHVAMAVAQMMHAAATGGLTAATAAEIAAQNGLNAAMFACPITWIIIMVIALIAIFYAAVAAVNKFAGTTVSATGIICGVIATAAAVIANIFIGLANTVIGIGIEVYNLIASFANFFANVFNDPVGAIMRLFADLFDFIAGIVQSAAKLIDTVLGSNLSGAVAGFRENFSGAVSDIIGDQTIVMEKKNAADYQLDRISYGDAWEAGYSFGEGIEDTISNFSLSDVLGSVDLPTAADYPNAIADGNNLAGQTAANTGDTADKAGDAAKHAKRAADSLDIANEDLKYLRDIAETDYINRFTTAEITVHQTNHNSINNEMDLDGVTEHLRTTVEEQMAAAAEGAH